MMRQKVIHLREEAETFSSTKVAVAYSPKSRSSDIVLRKLSKSNPHAVVVGKGTLLEDTLSVTQTQETNWDIPMSAGALELQKTGEFLGRWQERFLKVSLLPLWPTKHHWYHVKSMRCAITRLNLGRKAQATPEKGFAHIEALAHREDTPMATALINNCTEKAAEQCKEAVPKGVTSYAAGANIQYRSITDRRDQYQIYRARFQARGKQGETWCSGTTSP